MKKERLYIFHTDQKNVLSKNCCHNEVSFSPDDENVILTMDKPNYKVITVISFLYLILI